MRCRVVLVASEKLFGVRRLFAGVRGALGKIAVVEGVEIRVVGGVAGLLEAVESEVVKAVW